MRRLRRFFQRLFSPLTRHRAEERLREEIEGHIELQTLDNIRAGLSAEEARRQAVIKFGGAESTKEEFRERRGLPALESLVQETRYALRALRWAPMFTAATVLTLALGIGATTSIFTLVHAVLLKTLPVRNPAELYRVGRETHCCFVNGYSQQGGFSLVSYALYQHLRDYNHGFVDLAAVPSVQSTLGVRRAGSADSAEALPGEFVSGNYFRMFGVDAQAGRALTPEDDRPGAPPVAVMSYRLWREKYGADASVVGSVFHLNEKPFTVVGIAPPGFFGDTLRDTPTDLFLPLNTEPFVEADADLNKYDVHWLALIGRMSPGVSPSLAEAKMRVLLKQWLGSHRGEMSASDRESLPRQTLYLSGGGAGITSMRERYESWLRILMAIAGFVLLIVCANVAHLMLVRGLERRRHTSLCAALGARPWRLVRQPLIESVLLSLMGGVAGLAVAFASTRAILHFAFPPSSGLGAVPIDPSPDLPVLLFAFLVALATGIGFGIAPAWMAARVDPIEALRGAGRTTSRAGSAPRKALVVLQTALSLALLSAAGLLTNVLQNLEQRPLGFQTEHRLVAKINPRLAGYRPQQLPALYARLHDAIASVPGVESAALSLYSPPGGGWGSGVAIDGPSNAASAPQQNVALWDRVGAGYFDAVGTRVTRGRGISEEDSATSRHVAVVSEAFARRFFGADDPVGRHFGRAPDHPRELEIVGVVEDASYFPSPLLGPALPAFFVPVAQADYTHTAGSLYLRDIVIRTRPGGASTALAAAIQQAAAGVDPNLPVPLIHPLHEQVAGQLTQQRLIARLTSLFAILSLILASIGLYGVTAYQVSRRTGEIGVRMALGAGRAHIVRLVVSGAFALVAGGLVIGLPLTFAAGRMLASQLYGLPSTNVMVTLTSVAVLGATAVAAAVIPALRASRVSPTEALRSE